MRRIFADTGYWIALLDSRDELHLLAKNLSASLADPQIVTSEWILTELLNSFAERGTYLRKAAADAVAVIAGRPDVIVVSSYEFTFQESFQLFKGREDKSWSLTDCSSFLIMKKLGITESLTYDQHFEQANFKALLRPTN